MDLSQDSVTSNSPSEVNRRRSGDTSAQSVFGFPLANNQFNVLETSQTAGIQCQSSEQEEDEGLIDPRTTRALRIAALRADDRGNLADVPPTAPVPSLSSTQGMYYSGIVVNPDVPGICSQTLFVQNSFSACSPAVLSMQTGEPVQYMLGEGVHVRDGGDSLYNSLKCNKRISCAGPEMVGGATGPYAH